MLPWVVLFYYHFRDSRLEDAFLRRLSPLFQPGGEKEARCFLFITDGDSSFEDYARALRLSTRGEVLFISPLPSACFAPLPGRNLLCLPSPVSLGDIEKFLGKHL